MNTNTNTNTELEYKDYNAEKLNYNAVREMFRTVKKTADYSWACFFENANKRITVYKCQADNTALSSLNIKVNNIYYSWYFIESGNINPAVKEYLLSLFA